MATLKRWNGSSWVTVPNGSAVKRWNGSSWVNATGVYYWNGSSWIKCWNKSDPTTINLDADFTSNIRWEGGGSGIFDWDSISSNPSNKGQADIMVGRYNGSYPYHYVGIIGFPQASLVSAMNTRPTVVSARLRLQRISGSGLGTLSGANPLRIGTWVQTNFRSTPYLSDPGNHDDWSPLTSENVNGWAGGSSIWIDIPAQNVIDQKNGWGLVLSEITTGYKSSGGTTNLYSKIGNITDGTRPRLEVTLDY